MQLLHCVENNTHPGHEFLAIVDSLGGRQKAVDQDSPVLSDLLNLARADAGCADPKATASPVHQRANRL
jgi:hypothetical protein